MMKMSNSFIKKITGIDLSINTTPISKYSKYSNPVDDILEGASKSIELKGTYGPEYTNKLQSTYNQFANEGVDITEHGLRRVLGRSSRGVTVENRIDVYNNGKLYYDPQYNTNIKFKDGIAVSYDIKTGQIVNVQTQNNPTSRWIAK